MKQKAATCLRCDTEMVEGWLLDQDCGSAQSVEWIQDRAEHRFWPFYRKNVVGKRCLPVQAYRCPSCAHVELFARLCELPSCEDSRRQARRTRRAPMHETGSEIPGAGRVSAMISACLAWLAKVRHRVQVSLGWRWKGGHGRTDVFRLGDLPMMGHSCRWCKDEVLRRAEARWSDYPLFAVGIRPYYCPHCFMHFYRFK